MAHLFARVRNIPINLESDAANKLPPKEVHDMEDKETKAVKTEEDTRLSNGRGSSRSKGRRKLSSCNNVSLELVSTAFEELLEDRWSLSE